MPMATIFGDTKKGRRDIVLANFKVSIEKRRVNTLEKIMIRRIYIQ